MVPLQEFSNKGTIVFSANAASATLAPTKTQSTAAAF